MKWLSWFLIAGATIMDLLDLLLGETVSLFGDTCVSWGMSTAPLAYTERLPASDLRELIQNYWFFEISDSPHIPFPIAHKTIPDSSLSIVMIREPHVQGVRTLGPHTHSYEQPIFANSYFLGIRFHPWLTFAGSLPSKQVLLNQTAEAPSLISAAFGQITEQCLQPGFSQFQLLDETLHTLLPKLSIQRHPSIQYICLELAAGKMISEVVASIPKSIRVIQKSFKLVTGVSMKQFANAIRQRKVWEDIMSQQEDVFGVIVKHGFYDQSHFIRSFQKSMRDSPSAFKAYHEAIALSLRED